MTKTIGDSSLVNAWASNGPRVDPGPTVIADGFSRGVQPMASYDNFLDNLRDSKLNHILRNGIPLWNATTSYMTGDICKALVSGSFRFYFSTADNNLNNVPPLVAWRELTQLQAGGTWAAPTGTLARTTFATYAGQTVSASPTQAQVQAIDDHVKILSQRLAALITDLKISPP